MTRAAPPGARPAGPGRLTPVEKFLGPAAAAGGPFALLDLGGSGLGDDEIIAALDRQLARMAQHVECNTPEADEVRLALHAAAAQLLDRHVRRHLIARWGWSGPLPPRADSVPIASRGDSGPAGPAAQVVSEHLAPGRGRESAPEGRGTPAPPRRAMSPADLALERDAVVTLGMHGGWNDTALRRLVMLAHARGLTADDVGHALQRLGGGRAGTARPTAPIAPRPLPPRALPPRVAAAAPPPQPPPPPGPSGEPLPEQIDPAHRQMRNAILGAMIGVAVVVVVAIAVMLIVWNAPRRSSPPAPVAATTPKPAPVIEARPRREDRPKPAPAPPAATPRVENVPQELRAAAAALESDPGAAADRFGDLVGLLSREWRRLPNDRLVATQHEVIEFLYKASGFPGVFSRAIEAVAAPAAALHGPGPLAPDQVAPAVWAAGMLTRLSRERDLSAAGELLIAARLNAALRERRPVADRSFEAGAAAAIQAIPPLLLASEAAGEGPPPDLVASWEAWIDTAGRLPGRERAILGGLEALLVRGPDPSADEAAFKIVRLLVARLTWRPGDESRARVVRWFDDKRISSSDLYAVTAALATGSSAQGIDATMVLPTLASEQVRAEYREAYAQAWGLGQGVDRRDVLRGIATSAATALAPLQDRGAPHALASAVVLSRLSAAASWSWRGQPAAAHATVQALHDGVDVGELGFDEDSPSALTSKEVHSGSWVEQYLAARRNIPVRRDLLDRYSSSSSGGPAAAEVLVHEAIRGTPAEIRRRAASVVRANAREPAIVNALLELLPDMPMTIANQALVESVVLARIPRGPDWGAAARRALVERLLELVATEGELGIIDRLSTLLARSYEQRVAESPPDLSTGRAGLQVSGRTGPPPSPVDASAAALYRHWQSQTDPARMPLSPPITPAEVERRRTGRLALARGPVQMFAAHQVSACELMAYTVASEHPAESDRVRAILDDLAQARQAARHIFHQVRAAEAAMLRLWLIRLGIEEEGAES